MTSLPTPTRVDIGCGPRKAPGFIGVDIAPIPGVDIVADLNKKFPFEDSTVDELRAYDAIEHLVDRIHTMNEIWRVCKPGAKVDIFVPSSDGRGAFQDPTHVSFWNINSFKYYCIEFPGYIGLCHQYGFKGAFRLLEAGHVKSPDEVIHVSAKLEVVKPVPWDAELSGVPSQAHTLRQEATQTSATEIKEPVSSLDYVIPPEIKHDESDQAIQQITQEEEIRTISEIGSLSGQSSMDTLERGSMDTLEQGSMDTFTYKGKVFHYNSIKYNNPSERAVEIPIGFEFLVRNSRKSKILEVGNTLSNYENFLSEYIGIKNRKIIDKFEKNIGVDQIDLMEIPSTEKYGAVVCISTAEHIGQGENPQGIYGEVANHERDREAPLKGIAKIYEILEIGGEALITVPFGKLIDGNWYIQFSQEYLDLLFQKYQVRKQDAFIGFLKKTDMRTSEDYPYPTYQRWIQVENPEDLSDVEYNNPFLFANSIAVIELSKSDHSFRLNLAKPPSTLEYASPIELETAVGRLKIEKAIQRKDSAGRVSEALENYKSTKHPYIAIDGVFFQLYNTGIARVWRSLLEYWSKNEFRDHIIVLERGDSAPKFPGIKYLSIPEYSYNSATEDRGILQAVCDYLEVDLFISTYYTSPISTPSVFMAYDMIPEVMGWDLNHPMWREKHRAIQQASAYVSISQNTANDLAKLFSGIDSDQITVALCGVSDVFKPASTENIIQFKERYSITKPYFILVGANSGPQSYKNAILFFQAFAKLPSRAGFEVICTGSDSIHEAFREYVFGTKIHALRLSDEELGVAYSGAIALVYPSKYEGFGLPLVEAMACGCPIITSPNASIPEVVGEAGLYVNSDDVIGMTTALCEIQKPELRQSLISVGKERAEQFTWQSMAETVQAALIRTTLANLNLQDINYLAFPDWTRPIETLGEEFQNILRSLSHHPDKERMTLVLDGSDIAEEEAELLMSSIAVNLMLEEEIDFGTGPKVALTGELSSMQWSNLLKLVQGRISLEGENTAKVQGVNASLLPIIEYDM
ncbi:MAG: glycosyltransferase [Synechococcales bacterium]|nr:glycosyltransferase [Synechococcales bacterium]